MEEIDERYKNGKIYTVRCRCDDSLIYVGSTIQILCKRMAGHRRDKRGSLYLYLDGDWDNWYIELYEEYPCNNKSCLEKREGEVIRLIGTINKFIAGRTNKEYYEENKEKILENQKKYYEDNKEKIKEQKKEYRENNEEKIAERDKKYYEDNKEKILEKVKEYRQNNREKILKHKKEYNDDNREKRCEKVECDKCKSIVSRNALLRHKKSLKCQNYVPQ